MIDFENADFIKLRPVDQDKFEKYVVPMLVEGEEMVASFQGIRDGIVFTTKRIIAINVQGMTGKRNDFTSLPYKKFQAFSVETAGVLDLDGELQVWFSGLGRCRFEFSGGSDLLEISRIIGTYLL